MKKILLLFLLFVLPLTAVLAAAPLTVITGTPAGQQYYTFTPKLLVSHDAITLTIGIFLGVFFVAPAVKAIVRIIDDYLARSARDRKKRVKYHNFVTRPYRGNVTPKKMAKLMHNLTRTGYKINETRGKQN